MKIMAIDFGDRHIGLAVSDDTASICGAAWTMDEYDFDRAARRVADEAADRGVSSMVLGLPKNMDGSLGVRAERSLEFAELLREYSKLPVTLWDERRTTVDAHRILSENGKRGKKRKKVVDAVAAALILEGYLGTLRGSGESDRS